ncbi:MAG: TIGR04086 family membrane protein [Oscillospiraceae bacterium]|nr:TIGR04086 family membrane protein [Oscillospiraceae bacterium]
MGRRSKPPVQRRFRVYIASVAAGAISSVTALVLFALLSFLLKLPVGYSGFFSLLAFGIGCLVAGFSAGMLKRQGGLASGIAAALLFTLPVALIGFVLGGLSITAGELNLTGKIIVAVLGGAVGGVLGVNKNGGFK